MTGFLALPPGHVRGRWNDRPYGLSVAVSADGRRRRLYAEALDGGDRVSCNLYLRRDGTPIVRPCEMPLAKVEAFVSGFRADDGRPWHRAARRPGRPLPSPGAGGARTGEAGERTRREARC